jgi:hypothetical protein
MLELLRRCDSRSTATINVSRDDRPVAEMHVEVAASPWRRARGLMGRKSLAADGGMIFVLPWRRIARIWMAGTPIPLDVLFVEPGGTIMKIAPDREPHSLKWTSSETAVRWVLELAGGTAARLGIRVGDRVDIGYGKK